MSNMKLIIESWRSFIAESVNTDISDAVSKNVALCKLMKDDVKYYILYNPIYALERLKYYTDYNGQYKNPPKDNYTNLNPFREAVQDSILSAISLKPSTGGKKNIGPYDAKEINYVVSNKKGFGRILYVISMADHVLFSDRGGNVTKFAQDVWRDFYNNSQEIEKEPKTGNLSRETFPKDGIVKIKIDNISKPETETKEDDGEVYADRGSNDPLNYVYFNLSGDRKAIQALEQNNREFETAANKIITDFNKTVQELQIQFRVPLSSNDSFMTAATNSFSKKYKEMPDAIKYIKEEVSKALEEKWSEKYKRSIDCNNPKGFSQRAHCQGRKKNEGSDPKVGTGKKPEDSGRRLYTDENPKDTVSVKFSTVQDIKDTLSKESFKSKPHARQSQIINLIHQRVRAAYENAKDPEVKARLKKAYEYAEQRKEASKEKTASLQKEEQDVQLNEKCWEGYTQKGMKTMFGKKYPNCVKKTNEEVELEERKLGKPSSETNLGDWFKRKGAPGKKGGWVDCNTCRDGKCKPCGRQEGEKRSKYPRCRPTPAQCKGYKRRGDNLQKEE